LLADNINFAIMVGLYIDLDILRIYTAVTKRSTAAAGGNMLYAIYTATGIVMVMTGKIDGYSILLTERLKIGLRCSPLRGTL
jgi:hypothetical protein